VFSTSLQTLSGSSQTVVALALTVLSLHSKLVIVTGSDKLVKSTSSLKQSIYHRVSFTNRIGYKLWLQGYGHAVRTSPDCNPLSGLDVIGHAPLLSALSCDVTGRNASFFRFSIKIFRGYLSPWEVTRNDCSVLAFLSRNGRKECNRRIIWKNVGRITQFEHQGDSRKQY